MGTVQFQGSEGPDSVQPDLPAGVSVAHSGGSQGSYYTFARNGPAPSVGSAEMIPGGLSTFWKMRKTLIAGAEGEGPSSCHEPGSGSDTSARAQLWAVGDVQPGRKASQLGGW